MRRGHLEERRPGVWRFRVSAGTDRYGKQLQQSKTFEAAGRKTAEKVATQLLAEWDRDEAAAAARRGTVAELVDEWVKFRADRDSPTTIYRRTAITNRIVRDLGHIRLADLSVRDVDMWLAGLLGSKGRKKGARPMTAATVNHYLRVLRAILEQGERWDMVPRNVAKRATPPRVPHVDQAQHMPTVAAVAAALTKANRSVRVAVLLAVATGCRRGEIVGLRWSDLEGNVLTVRRALVKVPGQPVREKATKAESVKRVLLGAGVLQMLAEHRASQEAFAKAAGVRLVRDGWVVAHQRADPSGRTPFSPDWLSQEWERLCDRSKLSGLHLHGIRHLHGSTLAASGVPLPTVQKQLGHRSLATTTDHYLHSMTSADLQAADVVAELVAPLLAIPPRSA